MRVRSLIVLLAALWAVPLEAQLQRFPSIEIGTSTIGCRYQSLDVSDNNPNGDVTGSICDQVNEVTTGVIWTKTSGTATTSGWVALTSSSTTGTVTSVALTAPGIFSVAGTPITTSGTLSISLATQSAGTVWAGPISGSAAQPTFRALDTLDLPVCANTKIYKSDGTDMVCSDDAGASSGAPTAAQYLTLALDASLSNERVLDCDTGITCTDNGADGDLDIEVDTAVVATLSGSQTLTNKTLGSTLAITAAPTLSDGIKWTFNPDGTNAGINVGSHAGDPGSPANGDLWYDSSANELTARINGANVALGAGGGGSPGGSSGDLQINDGAGGFDPYAGDGCSPGDFVTDIAADGSVTCDTPAGGPGGGAWSLRFMALANLPPTSNPATFNTRNTTPVLEFDTTTQETAVFLSVLPNDYAGGGVTVCAHWAAASATTGTIGWDVAFERIGDSQQDIDSDGFGTAATITATTVPGTSGHVDITCVNIANGSDMDSVAAGEAFRLRIRRDVSNDNAAGDAQIVAVDIREQ